MNKFFSSSNLNINSWLINWGYLSGYLYDGVIESTKFGIINQWTCILCNLYLGIKHLIFLFNSKESRISYQLGEWAHLIGPKLFIDVIIVLCSIHMLISMWLFNLLSKNAKTFYWLDVIDYDNENQCYYRAKLDESDSKMFIRRVSLTKITLKWITYSLPPFLAIILCIAVFKNLNDYHLNYIISILLNCVTFFYRLNYIFGLPLILYQVNQYNQKFFILNYDFILFQLCFYFQLKFNNLNIKAKSIINSKQKVKTSSKKINWIIKEHNDLCFMLKRFNDFWKYLLIVVLSYYIMFIWFSIYIDMIFKSSDLLTKLFMHFLLVEVIGTFACIVIIIFNVSIEVIIN